MANVTVDFETLKIRDIKMAKCEVKCAIDSLNSILAQLRLTMVPSSTSNMHMVTRIM